MNSKIMFFWGLLIVLICASLIIISNLKQDRVLLKLEKELKTSTYSYIKDNDLIPDYNESMIVSLDTLLEEKYIKENELYDEYCIKSVKMIKKFIFNEYEIEKKCDTVIKNEE